MLPPSSRFVVYSLCSCKPGVLLGTQGFEFCFTVHNLYSCGSRAFCWQLEILDIVLPYTFYTHVAKSNTMSFFFRAIHSLYSYGPGVW